MFSILTNIKGAYFIPDILIFLGFLQIYTFLNILGRANVVIRGFMEKVKVIARNKKIFRTYEIIDKLDAGIALVGTEIKSIRDGKVSFRDSFIDIVKLEAWFIGFHIAPYTAGNRWNHDENRKRKLLLNKREIRKWDSKVKERGLTVVPIEIYLKNGKAKLRIGLARGKTSFDKRHDIKAKDVKRDVARLMKDAGR